jgi:peptidoglycan hydrolase-like protein with peptidoglycan-binding domain
MEHYINIIFNKRITLGKIEETVQSVVSTGNVPLNEDGLEYEIFNENDLFGISIPLTNHIENSLITEFVNDIANKLFDKGFNDFDIELSLNEAERLTTFAPWRAEIEAAGYTISPSGTNIKSRDGGTVAGINDNGNLWSGSETITNIVRGNNQPSNDTQSAASSTDSLQQFAQSDQRGIANNPEQRTAITQLQQRLIDLGYDLGPMGADGIYGQRTASAIRAYQEANGLTVDGDAGPETINHILSNDSQSSSASDDDDSVDPDMSDQEAYDEFVRLLQEREFSRALEIADTYPSVRDRLQDSQYARLQELAREQQPDDAQPDDSEPNDDEPASANGYALSSNGTVLGGSDVITDSNDRQVRADWTLNLNTRQLRVLQFEFRDIYVSEVNGEERVRGINSQGRAFTFSAEFVNLLAGIKEHLENYDQQPATDEPDSNEPGATAPSVQTDVDQPETPELPTDSGVTITGNDRTDIPTLQAALGNPVTLDPPLDPGETSDVTGIENPVRYGTNMISGMPDIIYNAINRVAGELTERNALAFRDTLNYNLLSRDQVQSIIRELERAYPIVEIARAVRENDIPQDQKDALIVLLEVRQELNEFLEDDRTTTAPTTGTAPRVDTTTMPLIRALTREKLYLERIGDTNSDRYNEVVSRLNALTNRREEQPQTRSDGGLSIAREARNITTEIYTNLGSPTTGANTGEREIQAALQRIEDESMWNTVVGTYAQRYPSTRRNSLRTGELLGDLRGALSRRDWRRYVAPELERLGIEEEYDAPAETNESIDSIKIKNIVDEETYDGNDFYEAYGDLWFNEDEIVDEAEYQGRKVKLGKPMRGDVKKFKVYVKNPKGNVVKVNFGDPDMKIKKSNPARRKSFRARHNCDNPGPRHKARYWSCRKW